MTFGAHAIAPLLLAGGFWAVCGPVAAQTDPGHAAAGPQPSPRYASLKSDRVSLREGPGSSYRTTWVFHRAGLPVQIIGETEDWRQVRDAEGATGWVPQSMLSGRRTALVLAGSGSERGMVELRADSRESAAVVATLETGVVASIRNCDGRWCEVALGDYRGYIDQRKLWGVAPGEVVRELR